MVRVFNYKGKTIEELKKMSIEDFARLVPARQRRTLMRGFTEIQKKFLKKLRKSEKPVRTHCREMIIIPEMVYKKVMVYNGKEWISVDIKPTSCPNPLNVGSRGVLPVAICGTEEFDVKTIDIELVSLSLVGVTPLRVDLEDVATPLEPFVDKQECDECTEDGSDGFLDLTLKFDMQDIVAAIGEVQDGDCLVLTLEGQLLDGTPILGEDVVIILKKGKK